MDRSATIKGLLADFDRLRRLLSVKALSKAGLHQITAAQWGALMLLDRQERTVKEVAAALSVTSSAATQLLDGLIKNGYVVRTTDVADRRVTVVRLSQKGSTELNRLKTQVLRNSSRVFRTLTDQELRQYGALTKKVVEKSVRSH